MVIFQDVLIIIRESYIPNLSAENSVFLLLSNVGPLIKSIFSIGNPKSLYFRMFM